LQESSFAGAMFCQDDWMPKVGTSATCPNCEDQRLIQPANGPAWCPECEWNLGAFEEPVGRRAGRLERRAHRLAFRLNASTLAELADRPEHRFGRTRSSQLLVVISVGLLLLTLALAGLGITLLVRASFALKLLGALLVLTAIELRPRLPRLRRTLGLTDRAAAPELFAIIDEIGRAVRAPRIELIVVDDSFNAWCGRYGLRRRPILGLGLPLWGALSDQARVALVGHELGHLVNGDPEQALLTQPALLTFARLADLFNPRGLISTGTSSPVVLMGRVLLWPVHELFAWTNLLVCIVAARDHRRAECYADALAVDLGGTQGATELMGCLLFARSVTTATRRQALSSTSPIDWQLAAQRAVESHRLSQRFTEQHSLRIQASLVGSHPPAGLRTRMMRRWPVAPARIEICSLRFARSDAELAAEYQRTARTLNLR
jgi:Zn-dependent protease with chaperone function